MFAKGRRERVGMDGECGVSRCKLLYLEWISNEFLLYSTGNYIQSLEHDGIEYEKKNVCVCVSVCERERLGHFAIQQKLT